MARLRKSLWTIGAIMALPAPAAATEICTALDRLATAAHEPEPFASVGQALANGEAILPGFSAAECRVASGAFSCRATDFAMTHFAQWPDPYPCGGLSGAEISRVRTAPDWHHAYFRSGLYFTYGVSCVGCAGGAVSSFMAMPGDRPRPLGEPARR